MDNNYVIEKIFNNQIQVEASSLAGRSEHLFEWINNLNITSFKDVDAAQQLLKETHILEREMNNRKDELKKDALARCRLVDRVFKEALSPCSEGKKIIKTKILEFGEKVIQEQLAVQGAVQDGVQDETSLTKEDTKIKGIRETIKWVVRDESLVPREYLMLDEKKINADAKLGVIIPGIQLFKLKSIQ